MVSALCSARFAGRGCGRELEPKKQGQASSCAQEQASAPKDPVLLVPAGGRTRVQPRGDPGNFPFLKNFTGIAGVKGQLVQFQRDASTRHG